MKEFLVKTDSGKYLWTRDASDILEDRVIEIPETWMNFVYRLPDGDIRYSDNLVSTIEQYIIWQRSETECLMQGKNGERLMESVGQLKGVEATLSERQSTYGSFVGVANTTGQLMGLLRTQRMAKHYHMLMKRLFI